jgi:phage-related protein (TIGR01555 family)
MALIRLDSILNTLSGLGSKLDRAVHSHIGPSRLRFTSKELDELYESNDFAAVIVDKPANDAMRSGFSVLVTDAEDAEPLTEEFKRLGFYEKLKELHTQARLHGGAALFLVVDDGLPLDEPINWDAVRGIKTMHVLTRHEIHPMIYQDNIELPNFNEPLLYSVTSAAKAGVIHRDRLCVIHGRELSAKRKRELDGWGQSVIELAWEAIRSVTSSSQAIESAVHEFQYNILKVENIGELLGGANGEEKLMKRMQAIQLSRSFLRTTIIDGKEEWQTHATDFKGLVEAFSVLQQRLSTATNMPLTLIFGQSPQGFSTGDKTGMDYYHAFIMSEQDSKLRPCIEHVSRLLFAAKKQFPEKWEVVFAPLQVLSELERCDAKLKTAQTDAIYMANGVLDPNEVRRRFEQAEFAFDLAVGEQQDINEDLDAVRMALANKNQ